EIQFNSSGGPGLPPAGTPIEINGRSTTAGFNLSLRYTPCGDPEKPRCAFGFVYRSQSGMPLNGHFLAGGSFVSNTQINFVIPQVFTWGLAAWPIRDNQREWKVEVDIDKTDWHSFRNTNVTLTTLGTTIPVNRNWSDSITIMLGTEYKMVNPGFLPHWDVAFRGGYYFSQNAIPSATFDPAVPDANSHSVSVGMGFLCNDLGHFAGIIPCGEYAKAIGMDFAYQALVYETRHIGNNVPAFTSPLVTNGTYNTLLHVASVNLRVKF